MRVDTFPGRMTTLINQRTSNPKLSEALGSVEDFHQMLGAIDNLKQQTEKISPAFSVDDVTADVYNQVAAGQGLPKDLLTIYTKALTTAQVHDVVSAQLFLVGSNLVASLDQVVEAGLDTVCRSLHSQLQRVYRDLRGLRSVPAEASQAIAEGTAEDWQRKAVLLAEYQQIRDAQRSVLSYGWAKLADETFAALSKAWPIIGHAAGLGALWPELPEWNKYGRTQDPDGRMRKLTPPWPDPDGPAFIDWLLEHPEVQPWVPTLDQAQELLAQITSSAQTFYDNRRGPDQKELDRQYAERRRIWNPTAHVAE